MFPSSYIFLTLLNILWAYPVYKQRKGRFAYYFFAVGAAAVTSQALLFLDVIQYSAFFFLFFSYLAMVLLFKHQATNRIQFLFMLFAVIIAAFLYRFPGITLINYFFLSFHLIIFTRLLKLLITESIIEGVFNLFIVILMIYELTLVLRSIYILSNTAPSFFYNTISLSIELAMGLFFCFYTENNKLLIVSFGKQEKKHD
ncbi:MAG: hypothetical protein HY965_09130 [Ignavibacteriales bacterium]|nr:hypothetical protein [Ignavibacteriales bacterium]